MATASTSKQPSRSRSNSRHNQSNSKSSSNHNKATSSAGSAEVVKKRRSGSLRDTRDPSYSTSESGDNILDSENEYEAIEILEESRTEYLIRWAGVDPETNEPWEPSWQPKRNASEALVKTWIDSKKRRKTRSSIEKRRPSGVLSRSSTPKRKRIRIEDSFEQPSNSHKPRSRQRKRIRDVTSGSDDEEVLQTQDKISNINNNEVTPIPDTNLPIFLFQSPHSKGTQSRVDPLHLRSPSVFDSGDANDHTVPTLQSSSNVGPIPSPSPLSNVHLANNSTQSQALSISKTGISKSRSSKDPRQTPLANTTVQVSATSHEPLLNKPPERNISGTRFSHSGGPETAVKSRTPLPLSRESSNHKLPTSRGFSRPRANPPVIDIKPRSDGVHKRDLEFRKNLQQSHLLRDVAEPAEFQLGSSSSLFRAEDPWDTSLTLAPNTSDNVAKSDVVKKPIQEPALSPFVSRFLDVSPQKKTTPQRSSYTSVDQSSQPTDEVAQMIATFNDYTQTSSRISLQRFISTCDIDPVDRKMLVTYLDNPKAFLSHPKNGIQEAQCAYGGKDYVGFELQQEANGSICIWIELDEPDNPKTTVRWENERSLEKLSISLVSYHNPVAEGGSFLSPRPGRKRTPVPVGSQPFDCTPESQHIFKDNVLDAKNALIASEKLTVTASVSVEDMGSPHSLLIASEKDTQQELVPRTGLSEDSHRLSIDSDFLFTIDEYTGAPTNDRPGAIPQILIASPAEPVQPGITTLQSPIPDPHDTLTPDSRHSSPSQRPWPNSSGHIPSNPSIIVPGVDDVSSVKNHDAPSHTHPVVQEQQEGPVPSSIVDSTHESSRANDADRRVGPEDDEGSRATTVEESRPREHSSVSTVSISESDSPEKLKKNIHELRASVKFLRSLLGGALDLNARAQAVEDVSFTNSLTQKKVKELEDKLTGQEQLAESWQEKYKAKDIEVTGLRVQMLDFMSQNDTLSKENRALRARLKDSNHPARHVYDAFSAKMKADVARLESENHLFKQTIKRLQARLCEQSSEDQDQDGLEFRVANLESKNETLKEELCLLAQAEAEAQALVTEARAAEAIHRERAEMLEAALKTHAEGEIPTHSDEGNTTKSTEIAEMLVGRDQSNTDTSHVLDTNAEESSIDHNVNRRRSQHPESVKKATRSSVINLPHARSSYLERSTEEDVDDVKPVITDSSKILRSSSRGVDSDGSLHRPTESQGLNGLDSASESSASRGSDPEARRFSPMEEDLENDGPLRCIARNGGVADNATKVIST